MQTHMTKQWQFIFIGKHQFYLQSKWGNVKIFITALANKFITSCICSRRITTFILQFDTKILFQARIYYLTCVRILKLAQYRRLSILFYKIESFSFSIKNEGNCVKTIIQLQRQYYLVTPWMMRAQAAHQSLNKFCFIKLCKTSFNK